MMVQRYEKYLVSLHQSYLICVVLRRDLWGRTEVLGCKITHFLYKNGMNGVFFYLKNGNK